MAAAGDTGPNATSVQEGDHSVLKGIHLLVPCNTWSREHAIANFGVDSLDGKTEAEVTKVRTSVTKVPIFTIRFPKFKSSFDGYNLSYIYRYAVEIPAALQRQHGAYLSSAKYVSDLNTDKSF